ncbi:hypothetical protein EJ02DRAFT_355431 [Clathrospora elynae]|uniref:Uncharacterized protein n=1 Tax=Clathrospora elynae TaxID=706981 RepID=A0A6A5SEF4_9PLEO|nr:hypothetical protein EJ02DRAFT_355431 [Clathrospora elynae]
MTTESDPAVTRVTVVLDRADDWHKWLFIRKDTAQKNELWQYVNPAMKAADLPLLIAPPEPQLSDHNNDATSIADLTAAQQKLFQWEYERWERKDIDFRRQKKAMAKFNSEIGKTIAAKHLYLIENKDTPYDRLTTLKKHLAPSDATRKRDLIARYKAIQLPPRGKKIEEWLRSWVEVTNMCISAEVPETTGSRAQEDFLVVCRTIDPEYRTSVLRATIDLEEAGNAIPSVDDYVSNFTAYLKRVQPLSTGLSSHPQRPKAFTNAIGQRKLDAALAADPELRDRVKKVLGTWRAKQQGGGGGSIVMDDGNPPTRPTANILQYTAQDLEQFSPDADTHHDGRASRRSSQDEDAS